MQKLESIKLFKDLQKISTKYINLELRNNTTEVEAYNKMQELLLVHKSQLQQIKEKSNSISMQIREEIKSNNCNNIYNNIIQLNNLFKDKCNYIKNSDMEFENTCIKITLLSTVDKLSLVNESVMNKDFLSDKCNYFSIYENVIIDSFINLLVLKDMGVQISKLEAISQAVISQIQTLSLISM
ncbi:MAG: hypothetical protein II006_00895 [Peptostreptococcaceae bacterium]|nr:hypothetical protein [Peptostreptococcaceae bacterium]